MAINTLTIFEVSAWISWIKKRNWLMSKVKTIYNTDGNTFKKCFYEWYMLIFSFKIQTFLDFWKRICEVLDLVWQFHFRGSASQQKQSGKIASQPLILLVGVHREHTCEGLHNFQGKRSMPPSHQESPPALRWRFRGLLLAGTVLVYCGSDRQRSPKGTISQILSKYYHNVCIV